MLISWTSLLDLWEKQDPQAFDCFFNFYKLMGLDDPKMSPYERLIQIHQAKHDTNSEFFDSLIHAVHIAANIEDEFLEIDFCEEGVSIDC